MPLVRGDFVLLELVLLNLLDNAMKYAAKGSEIAIVAESTGGCVQVSVFDQGVGIPEADLVRVFDKFYRVRQASPVSGTGLGLSICKGVIEAHGGLIWAEPRPGAGTVIRFRLPVGAVTQTHSIAGGD